MAWKGKQICSWQKQTANGLNTGSCTPRENSCVVPCCSVCYKNWIGGLKLAWSYPQVVRVIDGNQQYSPSIVRLPTLHFLWIELVGSAAWLIWIPWNFFLDYYRPPYFLSNLSHQIGLRGLKTYEACSDLDKSSQLLPSTRPVGKSPRGSSDSNVPLADAGDIYIYWESTVSVCLSLSQ